MICCNSLDFKFSGVQISTSELSGAEKEIEERMRGNTITPLGKPSLESGGGGGMSHKKRPSAVDTTLTFPDKGVDVVKAVPSPYMADARKVSRPKVAPSNIPRPGGE